MTATPIWFGPPDRPLCGWLHVPDDGLVRGAVVLCPPLGLEGVCAHRTFRVLAERLADEGLAALRFDYDGTGDSAGNEEDPAQVEAWLTSVGEAVDVVRAAGARRVVAVGMRVGATLAACQAARHGAMDGIVLWDPCASGRMYLRESQALGLFSWGGGARPDGSVEVPGIVYGADTVKELGALSIADTEGPLAPRVLVLVRPDRAANKSMRTRLELDHVEWGVAEGQAELVDVEPWQVRPPMAAMDTVIAWASSVIDGGPTDSHSADGGPAEPAALGLPNGPERAVATVGRDVHGGAVTERFVRLGPLGLFGIVTEGSGEERGPTVILLNAGVINHVGPSRLWVEFARRWAAAGVRVLRFDLSGLGDSPVRPGKQRDEVYPVEAFDDIGEVVEAIAPGRPGDVILTGLCSGGYHAIEGAIAFKVGEVCIINPILTASPSETHAADEGQRSGQVDPRRQATTARKRWVRALPAHDFLGGIVDRLPDAAWWLINRVAVSSPPGRIIERLVDSGVDTYIVCGEKEARA